MAQNLHQLNETKHSMNTSDPPVVVSEHAACILWYIAISVTEMVLQAYPRCEVDTGGPGEGMRGVS